jgi:hypothetical protein
VVIQRIRPPSRRSFSVRGSGGYPFFSRLGLVGGDRHPGQETGGHLIGESAEVVVDLDLEWGEPGGVVSQSVVPLRLEGLGLLAEGTEAIVTGGDQGAGFGLKAHLHDQLTVAVLREVRSGLSVKGHDTRSCGKRTLFGNRPIALSDAGAGVEDLLRVNFGRVEAVILDFYHAAEHLGDLGRALDPGDESARKGWLDLWCHRLKHEGGEVVLEALRILPPDGREGVRKVHGEVAGYVANHVHRMDYPTYLAKGWAIGSGPIESACKTVIGKRMKGGGMRWGEDGADEMCHLRALFASGEKQWDAYLHPLQN